MKMNKYLALSLVAAGLSVASAGMAADNDTANKNSKRDALFNTLDSNQDGQLTAAEMAKLPEIMRQRRFDRLDSNGDGNIDAQEYAAPMLKRVQRRFERLDANGDGMLSADELTQRQHRRGRNKARSHRASHGKQQRRWRGHNRRGQRSHHRRHMRGTSYMFARMDRNNDGYVSKQEWQQMAKKHHRHQKRGHHGSKS